MKNTALKNTALAGLAFIVYVVCLSLLPGPSARAQVNNREARKFDEFGDIYQTDIKARLDNFVNQLQSEPGTRAFIVVYRSRRDLPGLSRRMAELMKDYLIHTRGISPARVVAIDAGANFCITQQLWIVPVGAVPKIEGYSNQLLYANTALKFDEYYYPMPEDDGVAVEYGGSSFEAFTESLRKEPNLQAYVIAYPQYYVESLGGGAPPRARRRVRQDPPGMASKMLKAVKEELVSKYGVAPSRVKTMNGGYRELRQVELWIAPSGAHPPIATPNTFPKRRR